MLLVPYLDVSWCLLCHHPLSSQSRTKSSTCSTSSLPIITLSSLRVFVLITLHFWAFSFSHTLPALSTGRLVLFYTCSYFDEIRTISYAKSRSSSILVKFHLMPFLCLSVFLCIVQSTLTVSRKRKLDMTHACLAPLVILNHFVCFRFSSNTQSRNTWSSRSFSACQGCDRPSWFSTVLHGVQSRKPFRSRQSLYRMLPAIHWLVLSCYGG